MTNSILVYKISELQQGYYLESGYLHCHYCDTSFAEDEVYPQNGRYFTAEAMIKRHIQQVHNGALAALLQQPANQLGVFASQQQVLRLFAQG